MRAIGERHGPSIRDAEGHYQMPLLHRTAALSMQPAIASSFQDRIAWPAHKLMGNVEGASTKSKRAGDEIRNMSTYRVRLCVKGEM